MIGELTMKTLNNQLGNVLTDKQLDTIVGGSDQVARELGSNLTQPSRPNEGPLTQTNQSGSN